jgi:hypothetical protein
MKRKKWKKGEFRERIDTVLRGEMDSPMQWHYVSFADKVFHGVVIIQAHGITDALTKCNILGINPGGQVMAVPMPDEIIAQVPEADRTRLLSKEDVKRMWPDAKSIREHEEEHASAEQP